MKKLSMVLRAAATAARVFQAHPEGARVLCIVVGAVVVVEVVAALAWRL